MGGAASAAAAVAGIARVDEVGDLPPVRFKLFSTASYYCLCRATGTALTFTKGRSSLALPAYATVCLAISVNLHPPRVAH